MGMTSQIEEPLIIYTPVGWFNIPGMEDLAFANVGVFFWI